MGMTFIVKTVTRLSAGLIIIFGVFTVLKAHYSPGGGFAGGVIIALAFINLVLAFGKPQQAENKDRDIAVAASVIAVLLFLVLSSFSLLGVHNEHLLLWSELAVMIFAASGLYLVFIVLVHLTSKREKR